MDREQFWAALGRWVFRRVRNSAAAHPLLIGLSAPQGAGKTTLTRELIARASAEGLRAAGLSIDDFYLTHDEQVALARRNPDNPYLQQRVYPGTHDIALGTRTLTALKAIGEHGRVALPSYDKTAFLGAGERRPASEWPVAEGPLDFVIVEGWMLGFTPRPDAEISDPAMRTINATLPAYAAWTALLDAFVWLEPEDPRFMLDWRVEAETRSRAAGNPGMSDEQVRTFVARSLPAYLTYLPGMREDALPRPCLHLAIGRDRLPRSLPPDEDA